MHLRCVFYTQTYDQEAHPFNMGGKVLAFPTDWNNLINLMFSVSQGKPVKAESTQALIDRTDAEKMMRALERLAGARSTNLDVK